MSRFMETESVDLDCQFLCVSKETHLLSPLNSSPPGKKGPITTVTFVSNLTESQVDTHRHFDISVSMSKREAEKFELGELYSICSFMLLPSARKKKGKY